MSCSHIVEFGAFNPRRNLPAAVRTKRGEANFLGAFERGFTAKREGKGIGGRHFAVSGYGIADFIWAKPTRKRNAEPELLAFEMKLKDWRRALSQAYRYSYFADQSIVVLPPETAQIASTHCERFELLGIGLWQFDADRGRIKPIHTPKPAGPRNREAKAKALALLERNAKFRRFIENAEPL